MNRILSIDDFLNKIDPNGQIDRKQALSDITLVTILMAFRKASYLVANDKKAEIEAILANPDKDFLNNVYKIYKDSGKFEEFVKVSEEVADEIRKDYMKTQIRALTEVQRVSLFSKYPELESL